MPFIFKIPPPILTDVIFNGTGAVQTFNVPATVNTVYIKMWGGGGGSGIWDSSSDGGGGGFASGTLAVTPLSVLDVYVGMAGKPGSIRTGGFPGGGNGGNSNVSDGGGGGGFSAVFPNGNFTTPYIVAGAGAGGGTSEAAMGGGLQNWITYTLAAGQLGSQTAGGAGGDSTLSGSLITDGLPGSFLQGGNAAGGSTHGGGGGGGGYYGGGGGVSGNIAGWGSWGGGGSSYIGHSNLSSAGTIINNNVAQSQWYLAGNEADPFWSFPVGRGGSGANNGGSNGRVVISYLP